MQKLLPIDHPCQCNHRHGFSPRYCGYQGRSYQITCPPHLEVFPDDCPLTTVQNSDNVEDQQTQTANIDYTTVLSDALDSFFEEHSEELVSQQYIDIVAAHLNTALQKQHCA